MVKLVEGSPSPSLGVRAATLIRLVGRLAVMVPFAALLHGAGPAWGQVALGAAQDFAVLAGTAVTCTDSTLSGGDVGVDLGGTFTTTNCAITPPSTVHSGD